MQRLASLAVISALFLALACSDSNTPALEPIDAHALAPRYVLDSAGDSVAPGRLHLETDSASGLPLEVWVVADTLSLDTTAARYVQHAELVATLGGAFISRLRWSDHGVFVRTRDSLHFASDYIEGVAFAGALAATGRLRLTQNLASEGTADPFVFRPLR